jgi:hypothetical protein
MFVYLAMMFGLCAGAAIFLGQFFSGGEGVRVAVALAGFAWSVITVGVVYRYFVPPKKAPRWVFLTTPAAAHLGDACIYLNAICLQILWASVTASGWFTELVTRTPLGRPGSAHRHSGTAHRNRSLRARALPSGTDLLPGRRQASHADVGHHVGSRTCRSS